MRLYGTIIIVLFIPAFCGWYGSSMVKPVEEIKLEPHSFLEDLDLENWVDPMGSSEEPKNLLAVDTVQLIGRLAKGIKDVKGDHFWVCGERLFGSEREELAVLMAYNIVINCQRFGLNPWGVAGTIANESRFDPCALGKHPRIWGVTNNILKKSKNLSYSKKDVLRVIKNEKANVVFKKSGFDLGLCQVLSRFYQGDPEDMLGIDTGILICLEEMRNRAQYRKTDKPWLYWPGSKSPWYEAKIKRWAYKMGARKEEL